jgi:small-conductance mechanosensitive channel
MNTTHLIIGIIAVCWGSVMIYYSKSENVPTIIKPFIKGSLKNKRLETILSLFLGYGTVICGILFIIGGLIDRKLLPVP